MKYTITDKRLVKIIHNFLNRQTKPEVVCNYLIDYDYDWNKIVVDIFFKKNLDQSNRYKIGNGVISELKDFFGISPFVYDHIVKC